MPLRERSARAGLQVTFETDGSRLSRELNDDMKLPRSTRGCVPASARVVVRESCTHVGSEADIEVWAFIDVFQHVDEPLVFGHHEAEANEVPEPLPLKHG